ncbi:MAG: tetratricopeptide repeat protein [Leptolyngbya sp. SIO4C1]|nr:tetratricopeptide repeat protein [Leptolyngbya sp. SIO4C1]
MAEDWNRVEQLSHYYERARWLANRGHFEQAVQVLRAAIAAVPDEEGPYIALGDFLVELKRYREAIAVFEAALRTVTIQNRFFYRSYADALFALGDYSTAAAVYGHAIAQYPGDYNAHTRRIVLLAISGELVVASDALIDLAQHSESIAYLIDDAVAKTLAVYQQYAAGIRLFQTVLSRLDRAHSPVRVANVHLALGSLWIDQDQPGGAIQHLRAAQAIYQEYDMPEEAAAAEAMLESLH